ncbi:MAG: HxsD-like protein [Nanobdellota archaeon]
MKTTILIEDGTAQITLNPHFYPPSAITAAMQAFRDSAHITQENSTITIRSSQAELIAREFCNYILGMIP